MYFILIHSTDLSLINKAKALYSPIAAHKQERVLGESQLLLYSDSKVGKFNLVSFINNCGDIDNEERAYLGNKHDTIAAKFILDESKVTFITDYWGIMPYYYFHKPGTIVISNSIYLVRDVISTKISSEAIWEALLFKRPIKTKTWYESISASLPNELISLDLTSGKVSFIGGHFEFSIFEQGKTDYVESMTELFNKTFSYINDHKLTPAVSISAGSDSRTVLAGVMNQTSDFTAYSWGGENYLETARIRKLVERFNLRWKLQNFDRYLQFEHEMVMMTQLTSNGLAPGKHFYYHYSAIPDNSALFEGYGGSELFKTELSEGMLNEPYRYLITHQTKPEQYLKDFFRAIEPGMRVELLDYLMAEYNDYFNDVNTTRGFEMHQKYILEVVPARIFNGVFNSALSRGINLYEPFFSRQVLSALYSQGQGLKHSTSVTALHPGKYRSVKPEADIVRRLYPQLLNPRLDRGFSMKEISYPEPLLWVLNKARNLVNRLVISRDIFSGQVDMHRIETINLGKELHPDLVKVLNVSYQRDNICVELVNKCLNGLSFVETSDCAVLLAQKNLDKAKEE